MRVGLVVYGGLETVTGGYLYDRQLVDFLTAHGDTVEVVSLPPASYARALVNRFSPAVGRRLDGLRVDILLQDELCHPALLSNQRCTVVAVVHLLRSDEHRTSPLRWLYALVERRYLATVDAAVFNSDATRSSAERLVGRAIRGVVARPAADHLVDSGLEDVPVDRLRQQSRRDHVEPLRVIAVANVVPGKGLLTLVEALASLPTRSWRLTVAGSLTTDPAYVARLRRRIADTGGGELVAPLGEVPNDEIATLLRAHDVLAVPSSFEAAGIAYLEAMRVGLPVIATTAGGAAELVDDGVEGFLVAPGDVGELADRLGRWVADRALVARMGAAARERAQRHPTWAQSLEPVRAMLTSLVDRRKQTATRETAR
jgi:glycosyltransferase involved in cell wall biosynthesis